MGTDVHMGFGYGITVTPEQIAIGPVDEEDLWDVVESQYPELQFSLAGDYWNGDVQNSVIFVKSSGVLMDHATLTPLLSSPQMVCPPEGLAKLSELQQRYGLTAIEPCWLLWRYSG